jgi:Raf kinase inhibitor-like YbhB/YbcL family protein
MRLNSPAFKENARIPDCYTCEGADVSPPLAWSGVPAQTRSFVLICRDPDAPGKTFHHWGVYNIPATTTHFPENWASSGCEQAVNDFGRPGYGGPCPPEASDTHHYRFVLYALDIPKLPISSGASCAAVLRALDHHVIATAELIGTFAR